MARSLELARLFVTLETETKGLQGELDRAERSLGRLATFITKHPVAAAGALGTAAIAAGFKLAQMAEETNKALRVIADRVPNAVGHIDDLRGIVNQLAIQYGVSQDQIIATMDATARAGVANVEELLLVTRAATAAGKAIGQNGEALVGGLDAALDIFGLGARDATAAMAALFSIAEGRTSLEDMLDTVVKLAPAIQGTGLDFLTTSSALAALIDAGFVPGKKVIAEFTERLNVGGVEAIRALAAEAPVATNAMEKFSEAVRRNSEDLESNVARGHAQLKAALVELGTVVEPIATFAVKALTVAIGGKVGVMQRAAIAAAEEARAEAELTTGMNQLAVAGGTAAGAAGKLTAALLEAKRSTSELGTKSLADLHRYQEALEASAKAGTLDAEGKTALVAVTKELARRQKEGAAVAEAAAKKMTLAAEQHAAKYEAAMKKVQAATIAASGTLTDDLALALENLRAEFAEAGVGALEMAPALRKLQDDLDLVRLKEKFLLPEILAKSGKELNSLNVANLKEAAQRLEQMALFAEAGSTHHKEINALLKLIRDKQAEVAQGAVETKVLAGDWKQAMIAIGLEFDALGNVKVPKVKKQLDETVRQVTEIASGALGAAQAFGLVDSTTARVLQNIISIAASLPKAFSGDPSAIVSVIGNFAGVLSTLFGGDSPAEKARAELIRKNNVVLAELVAVNGDLARINQPGAKLEGVEAALRSVFAGGVNPARIQAGSAVSRELLKRGLSLQDLDEIAQTFGFEIKGDKGKFSLSGLRQLLEGLGATETGFNAQSFADQLSRIQSGLKIGAIAQEDELAQLLGVAQLSPGILKALAGVDLSTAGGREIGAGFLRNLFRDLETPGKVSKADLGGLSQSEFVDLIGQLTALLTSDRTFTGLGVVEGPAAAAVAQDADFYAAAVAADDAQISLLEQIVANTAAFLPLAAPVLPNSVTRPGAGALGHTFQISFEAGAFQFGGIPPDPEGFAREVVDRLEQELNWRAQLLRGAGPQGGRLDV